MLDGPWAAEFDLESKMQLSPFHILGLALPTLAMLFTLSSPSLGGPRVYREVYGDGRLEFEARFDTNPDGLLLSRDLAGVKFAGFLRENDRSVEVEGRRFLRDGKPVYRFSGEGGSGEGELSNGKRGCPDELHLKWHAVGASPAEGVLPSGPCYF